MNLRKIAKLLCPPILINLIRQNSQYGFYGDFSSWEEAEKQCNGYDDETIFNRVKEAIEKLRNGEAVFERDSVLFYEEDYNFQLLAALLYVSAIENRLNLIDFGGSLGSTYFQNKKIFRQLEKVNWNVIEQEHFVKYGQKLMGGGAKG